MATDTRTRSYHELCEQCGMVRQVIVDGDTHTRDAWAMPPRIDFGVELTPELASETLAMFGPYFADKSPMYLAGFWAAAEWEAQRGWRWDPILYSDVPLAVAASPKWEKFTGWAKDFCQGWRDWSARPPTLD